LRLQPNGSNIPASRFSWPKSALSAGVHYVISHNVDFLAFALNIENLRNQSSELKTEDMVFSTVSISLLSSVAVNVVLTVVF
jgi:hypothetical protein